MRLVDAIKHEIAKTDMHCAYYHEPLPRAVIMDAGVVVRIARELGISPQEASPNQIGPYFVVVVEDIAQAARVMLPLLEDGMHFIYVRNVE